LDLLGARARSISSNAKARHCEMQNRNLLDQRVFDWLDAAL
jgi:hypothetical protein